jgi:tetratricopeptide (TPR) repeat protein
MNHATPDQLSQLTEISAALRINETSELLTQLGALKFEPFHEPDEAATALQRAIEIDQSAVVARFWLAKVYFHHYCDYDRARQVLEEAISLDGNRADCLCLFASVLRETGSSLPQRLHTLQQAVELAPDWVMPHRLLADLHRDEGDYRAATNELETALRLAEQHGTDRVVAPADEYYERAVTGRLSEPENIASLRSALEVMRTQIKK